MTKIGTTFQQETSSNSSPRELERYRLHFLHFSQQENMLAVSANTNTLSRYCTGGKLFKYERIPFEKAIPPNESQLIDQVINPRRLG